MVTPRANTDDLVIRIDGSLPISAGPVAALGALCDKAEGGEGRVIVHVSGAPNGSWTRDLTVAQVSRWERALRRLERLTTTTIAVACGDCGGLALDALLATDYRIATPATRLVVPVGADATWPGMATYRLCQQAGAARTRKAVLFGIPIGAKEALALHLIDELVDDPATALDETAALTGAFSGPELAIRRQLMFDATITSFEDALGLHLAACDRALRKTATEVAS